MSSLARKGSRKFGHSTKGMGMKQNKPLRRSIGAIVASGVIAVTSFVTLNPAQARHASGCKAHYGYPAYYYGFPTYYYGGFYTSRVVFAPCVYPTYYGYFVQYRTVRRYW